MSAEDPSVVINWADEAAHIGAALASDSAWYAATAEALVSPSDRLAIDVGCGGAGMAIALTRALPTEASVVGVDGDDDILDAAQSNITEAGLGDGRIRLVKADLERDLSTLADAAAEADIIWASGSVHHLADQQGAIDALAGLLASGGRLALAEGGLPSRHLPWDLGIGQPGLEIRLHSAEDRWFARMRESLPGHVRMPYGWPVALRRAGLVDVTTHTSTFAKPAPLDDTNLSSLLTQLAHRVKRVTDSGELGEDDIQVWARILDQDDSAWLGARDDLYSLSARSVYVGHRPA
ncbi:methyltransferase domain-containing protein [Phytoactinopolyspora mesophila]|uniref:Methyltransferase domain-containing protein n=1 Tax=Phytoactinopolyspora mesophila TaxID=2650750 RepID=A0A7K3M6L0_9ACTN|nr:methyltransferase domain-containing protein [Phytoactinopolyspora mesophila]